MSLGAAEILRKWEVTNRHELLNVFPFVTHNCTVGIFVLLLHAASATSNILDHHFIKTKHTFIAIILFQSPAFLCFFHHLLGSFNKKAQVENGDVVGICVSGGLDSKTVALRLRLAGVKVCHPRQQMSSLEHSCLAVKSCCKKNVI